MSRKKEEVTGTIDEFVTSYVLVEDIESNINYEDISEIVETFKPVTHLENEFESGDNNE